MQTKLTLRMDDELIASAKEISHQQEKSLSQMVAEYFYVLKLNTRKESSIDEFEDIPPFIKSFVGIIPADLSDQDVKDIYHQHLEEKYL